ncbi:uncharacterized protein LOC112516333 [Cynara cardunculus var. scolymus]|uniref:uncharacterized protein LOC112516333 n=1 Tax=Cynara cardunculus var. scolymus TaxID=59895 RepID=UPI000D62A608|nr:uncharacterized protein LOC112516333 [Cynara cardunculus var. scolymus]
MNRRIRKESTTKKSDDGYLRYLKPGALAQLRDSKINARSHHRSSGSQIYLRLAVSPSPTSSPSRSPSPTVAGVPQQQDVGGVTIIDVGFPYFSRSFCGPRFPQRKKLMAAKSMLSLNANPNGTTADGPQSVIDVFSSDFLVAH